MRASQVVYFQIGKKGISEGVIDSLRLIFKNHKIVRISVLKSTGRDRKSIVDMADKIQSYIRDVSYKIVGFTIILKKQVSKR